MVLIWHYVNCQGAGKLDQPIANLALVTGMFWSGVDLFFVLSGLLIGGILIDHSNRRGFYKTFYIRRAARILPLYASLLILFFTCRFILDRDSFGWLFNDAIPDFSYLTFTQNIFMGANNTFGGHFLGVTWSLAVEEQFYLMVPLVLFFAGAARFPKVVVVLTLVAPLLRLAMPGFESVVNMPLRMDSLLIGVCLALAFRSESFVRSLDKNKELMWYLFIILLAVMGIMTYAKLGRRFLYPLIIATFYASFISLALIHRGSKITAILRSTLLVRLGMYSYGLYMYHQMVSGLIHGYFRGTSPTITTRYGLQLTLVALIVTGLVSMASYHTYEAYFLKLGRRFKYDSGTLKR